MREIKFKYYSAVDNAVIEWDALKQLHVATLFGGWLERGRLVQYTGLKDKNGVEIYDGDIIESAANYYSVEFEDGAFYGIAEDGDRIMLEEIIGGSVMGNIHQHPDLLTPNTEEG
jgi:uncharacterized phage protein (TIGR01671 family)